MSEPVKTIQYITTLLILLYLLNQIHVTLVSIRNSKCLNGSVYRSR